MELEPNNDKETQPFVIRNCLNWPCKDWTLQEWASKCLDTKFVFRVHSREDSQKINWENEAIDYIEATLGHLIERIESDFIDKSNPFWKYPSELFNFYSGYNYMSKVFNPDSEVINSIRWKETGLGDDKLLNNGSSSTIWMGTTGSYTPCHFDTYGYNFVAQIVGKKRWILFPPSDSQNIYPGRIPYEESSIFSQVNFRQVDLDRFPRIVESKPRLVELAPGDVLFVPRHWWHWVEIVSDCKADINISVNTWLTGNEWENSVNEAIVQILAKSLFDSYGQSNWINLNADLIDKGENIQLLSNLLTSRKLLCSNDSTFEEKVKRDYLEQLKFDQLNLPMVQAAKGEKSENIIDDKDIINCILHPDVINLIKDKLKMLSK